jgi:hypothetical protein
MESLLSASVSCIDEEDCYESSTNLSSTNTNNTINTSSNINNTNSSIINSSCRRRLSPNRRRAKYISDIEEVRINNIVSKKGYLNFLEEKSIGWNKKFVVISFI